MNLVKDQNSITAYAFLSVLILFYCFDYYLRIAPGLVVPEIMLQYETDALGIGQMGSAFYLGYLSMQIPAGLMLDRFNIKHLFICAVLLTSSAFALFALSTNLLLGILARFLVGVGSGTAFIGVLYYAKRFLPSRYFGLIAGLTIALGTLSASVMQWFAALLLEYFTVQSVFLITIPIALSIIITILLFPKQALLQKNTTINKPQQKILSSLVRLIRDPRIWFCGAIGGLFYLPTSVLSALWGINFFALKSGLTKADASVAIMMLFVGWTLGSPILGHFANTEKKTYQIILVATFLATCNISLLILVPLSASSIYVMMLAFGLCSSAQATIWALFNFKISNDDAGIGTACVNILVTAFAGGAQFFTGLLIRMSHGTRDTHYQVSDYQSGLMLLPIALLTVFACSFIAKQKVNSALHN